MSCCACPWASSTSTTCSPTSSRPWPPPLADPPPRPHRRTPHDQPVPLSHPSSHPRRRRGGHRRPAGRLQQRRERLRRWLRRLGRGGRPRPHPRSEEHTSELQSRGHIVCRLLL